jgi:hypothetical protein
VEAKTGGWTCGEKWFPHKASLVLLRKEYVIMLDVLLAVHHGTLMNQHQLDTLQWNCNLHAVNTNFTQEVTPNSICAEPPEDGRVTPETCRAIVS